MRSMLFIFLVLLISAIVTACTSVPECGYGLKYPDIYYKGNNPIHPQTRPCRKGNDASSRSG